MALKRPKAERLAPLLAYVGLAGVLGGLAAWLIERKASLLVELALVGGLALLALFVMLRPAAVRQALTGRRARAGGDAWIIGCALLVLLILLNVVAYRRHARLDLTGDRAYTLSPQTVQILKALDEPVKLTGFFVASEPAQAQQQAALTGLLDEYRYHSNKVSYEFVDPQAKPALAKQYGITRVGTLVLELGQKRQEAFAQDEQDLTAAILRVWRSEVKTIYFTHGHGERDVSSLAEDGYAEIRIEMERQGYRVAELDLAADAAPADAAALIVASPQESFTPAERQRFTDYLQAGGNVLLTLDPGQAIADPDLLNGWGLRVRDDLVIDPSNAFFGDAASPMTTIYPWHPITKDLDGVTTFFPLARSLELISPAPAAMLVSPLVMTSAASWGETRYNVRQQVTLDEAEDVAGPLVLAVAIQEANHNGRMVVFGSSFFAANNVLTSVRGDFGNSELFLNAIRWLTEDDDLIAIQPRPPQERHVTLTRAQRNLVLYSSALLLPLAILAAGFAVWWANR